MTDSKLFKRAAASAAVASLAVVGTAATAVAVGHKQVSVAVDGVTRPVSTWGSNVHEVLADAGVQVGSADAVSPARPSQVANGTQIQVRRAKNFTVDKGQGRQQVKSAASSIAQVSADQSNGAVSAKRPSNTSEPLPVSAQDTRVSIQDGHAKKQVAVKAGQTVDQVLAAAKVKVSPLDKTQVKAGEDGPTITVTRVKWGTVAEDKVTKKHTIKKVEDPNLPKGETKVAQEGKDEVTQKTTYRITENGKVVHETPLGKKKTQEMVEEVVHVGTKEKPAKDKTEDTDEGTDSDSKDQESSARPGRGTGSAPAGVWAQLAQCESGGNPATNTGNGFYGLYQFTAQTWQAMGGSGLPSDASAAEQTMRAQKLQQQAGWGQWPGCAASLGLR